LERICYQRADWDRINAFPDRIVFQTREWVDFLAKTQNAEPVLAVVCDAGEEVGYFTGLIVRRFGLRILGSPFPGWTTDYLGFNLAPGACRREAAKALIEFAYRRLRCAHVELRDRHLRVGDLDGSRWEADSSRKTFLVDISGDESEVFARMSSACRRAVRKGIKAGVRAQVAEGEGFADEYYQQLRGVFARQSLVPTYSVERVRDLIHYLEGTGRLLLLRALANDDRGIATGIFIAFNGTAYFWGGASVREDQILRPNEAIFWAAMKWARAKGCSTLDMGGGGEYKRRYGGRELWVPWFRSSRVPGLAEMRNAAKAVVEVSQHWRGLHASRMASPRRASDRIE